MQHGAHLRTDETVVGWDSTGGRVAVKTDKGEYTAPSLVITAGPWASQVLNACAAPNADAASKGRHETAPGSERWNAWLRVVRKPVFWFEAGELFDVARGIPTFFFETPAGQFYGFPRLDGRTIKVAEHTQGLVVADPLAVERAQQPDDLVRLAPFLDEHIPGLARAPERFSICMYTKSPDSHFCIDRHPEFDNVTIAAGFSGHGFKFTSVLGEALADLALDGTTSLPVGFLSLKRFAGQ
jgi:glycine/D-amino acid oxidase-like deaminating enzyme